MKRSEVALWRYFNLDKVLASRKMQSNDLADEFGCSVRTISKLKNGKVRALRDRDAIGFTRDIRLPAETGGYVGAEET